jgi:hypothetical protein
MAALALYERRIKDYVWLEISDVVTQWRGTVYSSDNAVAKRSIINGDPTTAMGSTSIQAEVLISSRLDTRWITFPEAGTIVNAEIARTSNRDSGFDLPF